MGHAGGACHWSSIFATLESQYVMSTDEQSRPLTLGEAQTKVDEWIKEFGVRYFSELTNLAQLVEEVGELARIMSRRFGDQSFKAGESSELDDEMADVLFVLICIANQTEVDLEAAFHRNLQKKTNRDSDRHRENPKLHDEKKQ